MCASPLCLYMARHSWHGQGGAVEALSSPWVLQGRQPRAPAQAGLGVQWVNHSSSVTSSGHPGKPPLHSCPVLNLQSCPNHSSQLFASVGFSCVCSCSNKSEEAGPACRFSSAPGWAALSPGQAGAAEPTHPPVHPGEFGAHRKSPLKLL